MRFCTFVCVSTLVLSRALWAQDSGASPSGLYESPFLEEERLNSKCAEEIRKGRRQIAEALLLSDTSKGHPFADDRATVLAMRAVSICASLLNDGENGRAYEIARLANRMIGRIQGGLHESETLYWQAILVGRFMDDYLPALEIVIKGRQIAPEDDRFLDLEFEYLSILKGRGVKIEGSAEANK